MPALPRFLQDSAPVFVAPMAGGPSTPQLVSTAAAAGHFAQLAAGYRTTDALSEQIRAVRSTGAELFGVNLFVQNIAPVDRDAYRAYAEALRPVAAQYGISGLPPIREDDDDWDEKISMLVADPVPAVSFTFGLPNTSDIARLRSAGSITMQTVTSAAEARAAAERGVEILIVQSAAAGGHSGVFDPSTPSSARSIEELIRDVVAAVDLPIIAAGGLARAADVRAAIGSGAAAVAVGTAVLRAPESGASSLQKDALADPSYDQTVLTRAFTGRPARALANRFVRANTRHAPIGYPAVHHLTKPIRAAATVAGSAEDLNLWAGLGWQNATAAPATETLRTLLP